MDQVVARCGECCGLPMPDRRYCAYFARYAYQISPKIEQKRSLTRMHWLVGWREAQMGVRQAGSDMVAYPELQMFQFSNRVLCKVRKPTTARVIA